LVLHLIFTSANAFDDLRDNGQSEEADMDRKETRSTEKPAAELTHFLKADVDQKKENRSMEKPAVQLIHFLKEPKREGPFTALWVEEPDGAGETAFIGSWTTK
jgi:hypothetical protein